MTTVTVSMPDSLKEFLEHEVQTKGYGNVSEYIRGLLRAAQARDADTRLEALLLEGLAGAKDIAVNEDFWKELKTDAGRILEKHKKPRKARTAK
jgi:antitoxin ParD1/3/4